MCFWDCVNSASVELFCRQDRRVSVDLEGAWVGLERLPRYGVSFLYWTELGCRRLARVRVDQSCSSICPADGGSVRMG